MDAKKQTPSDVVQVSKEPVWRTLEDTGVNKLQNYSDIERRDVHKMFSHQPKIVLDIGCSRGAVGRAIKDVYGTDTYVWGIELNRDAATIAEQRLDKVSTQPIEQLTDTDLDLLTKVDTVLLLDVLEHMYNPWGALKFLSKYLTPKAQVIVSLPNVMNVGILRDLLKGYWRYSEAGLLDVTHIRFFTPYEMNKMFYETGFRVDERQFVILDELAKTPQSKLSLGSAVLDIESREQWDSLNAVQIYSRLYLAEDSVLTAIEQQLRYGERAESSVYNGYETVIDDTLYLRQITRNEKELERSVREIEKLSQELEHTLEELKSSRQELKNKVQEIEQKNIEIHTQKIRHDKYKKLWTTRLIKPLIKTEQAISSLNVYRKGFRNLVRDRGSIGKAYQHLRRMRRNSSLNEVKQFLRHSTLGIHKRRQSRSYASTNNDFAIRSLTSRRAIIADRAFKLTSLEYKKIFPTVLSEIDLSVVTFNSSVWVKPFMDSLIAQNYSLKKINIFFVDNGSTDDTMAQLTEAQRQYGHFFNGFRIIAQDNVGFGAGHDRVFKEGQADFVLVSNIDLQFAPGSISNVAAAVEQDISGEYASWEFRQMPYEHPKYYDPVTLETNWSSHACILIRKSAYNDVGGYEPRIFMYAEDVELSYRFRAYGYYLKYCPTAVCLHHTYKSAGEIKPLQYIGSIEGNAYCRLRYGTLRDKVSIFPMIFKEIVRHEVFPGSRKKLISATHTLLKNMLHFTKPIKKAENFFASFRGFDYEFIRDGAFYSLTPISSEPKVSVVIRTYAGRERLLQQALLSVMNQTYKNCEIIVVEDGGSSMQELIECRLSNNQIRYYSLPKVERSVTGNYGLEMATGEYCIFLDDDDLFFADHVEVLLDAIQRDSRSVAAYSLAFEVPTNFPQGMQNEYLEFNYDTDEHFKQAYNYQNLQISNLFPIQAVMFRRDLYLQRGGFDAKLTHLEDWNLWLRYGYKNHFTYVPKTTSVYRTPASKEIKNQRHQQLLNAYDEAKKLAEIQIETLNDPTNKYDASSV